MKLSCRYAIAVPLCAAISLGGCAAYHKTPLNLGPQLKSSLSALHHGLPGNGLIPSTLPLTTQSVAALAVLNNPALIAIREQRGVAQAELLNAGLLPDPVISGGFAALMSGPANASAISGSLTQDLSALITYSVDVRAARAGAAQVDAAILWQEWQVASQAEQLCIAIDGDRQTVGLLLADRQALAAVNTSTSNSVAAGNLTIAASSSSLAALAATDTALNTAQQTLAQDKAQLDALLGLQPWVEIPVANPDVPPIDPSAADAAIASLGTRRPDLIALRYGYAQADAKLRAAILTQFLPVSISANGGSDTTNVVSIGPAVTLTLPLFNRNRGGIAIAAATRAQLAAQFEAGMADAQGGAAALLARSRLLQSQSAAANKRADDAKLIATQGQSAFANGSLDALSAVNLQTASADRRREAIALRVQLLTARLSLATLLGIGLPPIAAPDPEFTR